MVHLDALTIAQNTFGIAFDRERMRLRGHPIRIRDLMREVNKVRMASGIPQVLYEPSWKVEA